MADNNRPVAVPPGMTKQQQLARQVIKPKNMKGTLRRLWNLTRGHRNGLTTIFLLSGLASISSMFSPLLIGRIIDSIDKKNPITLLLSILILVYVTDWLVRFLQSFLMATVSQNIVCHIRNELFRVMKKLPLSFFDTNQHGDLMSRLTNDIDNISTTISDSLAQLMMLAFTVSGVFIIMLSLNVWLTLVVLITVPLVYLLTRLITKHTSKLFKEQQRILGLLGGHIEESITGLSLVKAYNREEASIEEFIRHNDDLQTVGTKALIWSGYLMPIMNVINNLGFILVSIISGLMAANGFITIGVISSFLLYTRQFARPLNEIANIYNTFQTAVAGAERIFEIFELPPEPEDSKDALSKTSALGNVVFDHVSFGYNPKKRILKDVSFSVPSGTTVAIVGPTGAGKTTIINLLTRFYDVSDGRILLDGEDIRNYRMQDLRSFFGVVLQDTSLFQLSVFENIRYGREGSTMDEVIQAAKDAGAHGFIERLPNGYNTILEEGGSNLSQGERQLITIARAFLADAPILILDEATSSVDTRTEQKIRKAMVKMTQGRTSFLIAHRLSTIRDSDIIILLEDGKIAEMGNHEELMKINCVYASMYRTQLGM